MTAHRLKSRLGKGRDFDVDARHIELAMPRTIVIANDDEVVVAGQRAGQARHHAQWKREDRSLTPRQLPDDDRQAQAGKPERARSESGTAHLDLTLAPGKRE
jgi:hypothetical protein